jgi:hypothetical protein
MKRLRRGMRVTGYKVAHTLLPTPVRRVVRGAFGGPSRYEERQVERKNELKGLKEEWHREKQAKGATTGEGDPTVPEAAPQASETDRSEHR